MTHGCGCGPDLRSTTAGDRVGRRPGGLALVAAGLGLILVPKCPMCLAASLWVFGSVGLAVTGGGAWVAPVLVAGLVLGLVGTSWGAGGRRGRWTLAARGIAVVAILVGRFGLASPSLVGSGVAVLVVLWLLDRRPPRIGRTDDSLGVGLRGEVA